MQIKTSAQFGILWPGRINNRDILTTVFAGFADNSGKTLLPTSQPDIVLSPHQAGGPNQKP
jgi:hypothetical protein